jgi:FkbH-like protein/FkbM family methyltransferase
VDASSEGSTAPAAVSLEVDHCRAPSPGPGGAPTLDEFQSQSHSSIEAEQFYGALRSNGNQYGPHFRHVSKIWRSGDEVLGKIDFVPDGGGGGRGFLNARFLDAVTQVLAAFVIDTGKTFVLQAIERVETFDADFPDVLWVRATKLPAVNRGGTEVRGSIRVFDQAGKAYLSLDGVVLALLDSAASGNEWPATNFVVAANFTAEPIEDSLRFWGDHFGMRLQTEFASYNQVFQQLLDPGSAMRRNGGGVNVVLLGLEEWATGESRSTLTLGKERAEQCFGSRARRILPNGLEIVHLNSYETDYLYKEIFEDQCYLRHGVTLRDGATVVDIGANIGLFSLFVTSRCKNPTIYAYEPAPVVYDLLKANGEAYGPGIRALNLGVSDRARTATFTFYEKSSVFSGFHSDDAEDGEAIRAIVRNMLGGLSVGSEAMEEYVRELTADRLSRRNHECRLTCVSDIIRENRLERIDLLKIDAEKSELEILQGIHDDDWGKIEQIVVEIHDPTHEAVGRTEKLLIEKGFRCAVEQESLLKRSGLFNLYAIRTTVGGDIQADAEPVPGERVAPGAAHVPSGDLRRNVGDFCTALRSFMAASPAPLVLCVCPRSPRALVDGELAAVLDDAERVLLAEAGSVARVHAMGSSALLQRYPVADYYDPESHQVGHVPYTPQGYAAIGSAVVRSIYHLKRGPFKVIALDCDNTLWKGVCGEDGAAGVEVDAHFRSLQEFMLAQANSGMLLCLCSRNNEADALAVFDQRADMPLKREHLVSWRINWSSKAANLKSLARELNLSLDSFIFVDDNPVECADVRINCPGVLSLQLPKDPRQFSAFLRGVWAFDRTVATKEDRSRTRMYHEGANRERYRQQTLSLKDFVEGLQLKIDVGRPSEEQMERVSQLTYRTNQFNFTNRRRSRSEIESLLERDDASCLVVSVSDRFGEYGLVGVVIFLTGSDRYTVDTLLLSCRVLGRGVEHSLVSRLGQWALEAGKSLVEFPYLATGKNLPALEFIRSIGERYRNDAGTVWTVPAQVLAGVRYALDEQPLAGRSDAEGEAQENDAGRMAPSFGSRNESECQQRIGEHLCAVEQIAKAIEEHRIGAQPDPGAIEFGQGNSLETTILSIWRRVLGRPRIGLSDNFFEAGGTSLRAVQVVATIRRDLKQRLSIVQLFECPTVRLLAARLSAPAGSAQGHATASTAAARGQRRRVVNVRRRAR